MDHNNISYLNKFVWNLLQALHGIQGLTPQRLGNKVLPFFKKHLDNLAENINVAMPTNLFATQKNETLKKCAVELASLMTFHYQKTIITNIDNIIGLYPDESSLRRSAIRAVGMGRKRWGNKLIKSTIDELYQRLHNRNELSYVLGQWTNDLRAERGQKYLDTEFEEYPPTIIPTKLRTQRCELLSNRYQKTIPGKGDPLPVLTTNSDQRTTHTLGKSNLVPQVPASQKSTANHKQASQQNKTGSNQQTRPPKGPTNTSRIPTDRARLPRGTSTPIADSTTTSISTGTTKSTSTRSNTSATWSNISTNPTTRNPLTGVNLLTIENHPAKFAPEEGDSDLRIPRIVCVSPLSFNSLHLVSRDFITENVSGFLDFFLPEAEPVDLASQRLNAIVRSTILENVLERKLTMMGKISTECKFKMLDYPNLIIPSESTIGGPRVFTQLIKLISKLPGLSKYHLPSLYFIEPKTPPPMVSNPSHLLSEYDSATPTSTDLISFDEVPSIGAVGLQVSETPGEPETPKKKRYIIQKHLDLSSLLLNLSPTSPVESSPEPILSNSFGETTLNQITELEASEMRISSTPHKTVELAPPSTTPDSLNPAAPVFLGCLNPGLLPG